MSKWNSLENVVFIIFTISLLSLGYMADSLMDDNITVIEQMESYPYYDYNENETEIRNDAGLFQYGGMWNIQLNDSQLFEPLNGQVVFKQLQYNGSQPEWINYSTGVLYLNNDTDYTVTNGNYAPIFGGNWTMCVYGDSGTWNHWTNQIIDSDGDGLWDSNEVDTWNTDPLDPDSDGDGLSDWDEVMVWTTDPNNNDTDGDGLSDSIEVNNYADSNNDEFYGIQDGCMPPYGFEPYSYSVVYRIHNVGD